MGKDGHTLDAEQRLVADAPDGPLLVVAGAGTGKTRALTGRAASLVQRGVEPSRILLVTFTQKAARAMTERLHDILPDRGEAIWTGTFHGIAHRLLQSYAHLLHYGSSFRVLSGYQSIEIMAEVAAELSEALDCSLPEPNTLSRIHSMQVNSDDALRPVLERARWHIDVSDELLEQVFSHYAVRKIQLNVMDYDDLLANWLILMLEYPAVRAEISGSFDHVLVDEYQDINPLQARILEVLASEHGNLTAVGDARQAIYGFRGAEIHHIRSFADRWGARTVNLHRNYRSTPEIVSVANACDRAMLGDQRNLLTAVRAAGLRPVSVATSGHEQGARFVVQRIRQLMQEGIAPEEQAILYRTHLQGRAIQMELQRAGVPHNLRSGRKFFDLPHVRDALAHLRIVMEPHDELAWVRALQVWPGVGDVFARRLTHWLIDAPEPWHAFLNEFPEGADSAKLRRLLESIREPVRTIRDHVLDGRPKVAIEHLIETCWSDQLRSVDETSDVRRMEDLQRLMIFCRDWWHGGRLLDELALNGHPTTSDEEQGVTLSTIHQSKGLEWDAVFVVGLIEGIFPLRPMAATDAELEEERRLFYVALTRARSHLYLCHPPRNPGIDVEKIQWPSRFLLELDEFGCDHLDHWVIEE